MITALLLVSLSVWTPSAVPDMVPSARTEHFQFHGTAATEHSVRRLAPVAEKRYQRLCRLLEACDALERRIDVYVAEDPEAFTSAFPDGSPMAEWAVGVAFPRQYRIVLRAFGSALFSLHETFDHEVSHVMLYAIAGDTRLPRWFVEGLAIWHADESVLGRLESAQRAAITSNLLSLEELDRRFPARGPKVALAYAQSALFVRYLARQRGHSALVRLVAELRTGRRDFAAAFAHIYGDTPEALAAEWEDQFQASVSAWTVLRDGSIFWVLMVFLFIWAYIVKRRERRSALAAMGEAEEADFAWQAVQVARAEGDEPTLHRRSLMDALSVGASETSTGPMKFRSRSRNRNAPCLRARDPGVDSGRAARA